MRYILWAQNESTRIEPTILADGIKLDGEDAQACFSKLNQVNQQLALSPELREKLYNKGEEFGFSRQINYKVLDNNEGVYIQSCYIEQDEVGRKMPFMFYYEGSNLKEAIPVLRVESARIGRTCNEAEMNFLLSLESKRKKKVIIKYVILIFVIVILCVILSLKH